MSGLPAVRIATALLNLCLVIPAVEVAEDVHDLTVAILLHERVRQRAQLQIEEPLELVLLRGWHVGSCRRLLNRSRRLLLLLVLVRMEP